MVIPYTVRKMMHDLVGILRREDVPSELSTLGEMAEGLDESVDELLKESIYIPIAAGLYDPDCDRVKEEAIKVIAWAHTFYEWADQGCPPRDPRDEEG